MANIRSLIFCEAYESWLCPWCFGAAIITRGCFERRDDGVTRDEIVA